jgi:hypothetical protein
VSEQGVASDAPPAFWRSFLIYSVSRLGVFAALLGLLYGVGVHGLIVVLLAFALSGLTSYFLLEKQRTALALALEARVERRRDKAAARSAREDAIADELIAAESHQGVPSGGTHGS